MDKSSVIFALILIGHYVMSQLIPKEYKIMSYFIAFFTIAIGAIVAALVMQKESVSKWAILSVVILISYTISNAVLNALVIKIENKLAVVQTINLLIFAITRLWLKLTKGLSANVVVSLFFGVILICLLIVNFAQKTLDFSIELKIISAAVIIGIAIVANMLASMASEKWAA
ncbi:MAG TPA: hypothetical protein VK158_01600 [Acidobacteriota bacterium]|nr:hypothetical protein [Acidobacteriota bacterium]